MGTVLAVDMGGTKTAVGLVNAEGRVLSRSSAPTPLGDPAAAVALAKRLADGLGDRYGGAADEAPAALGLALPGVVDAAGRVLVRSPSSGWADVPFAAKFEESFGLPASADNDVRASALAEARFGGGAGLASFFWITISTGIGGAAWVEGKALRGASSMAGELGHLVVRPGGARCACGNLGCLEAEASGSAWPRLYSAAKAESAKAVAMAAEHLDGPVATGAWLPPADGTPSAKAVADGARQGDPDCLRVVYRASEALARGVAAVVGILDPDAVFLGGGVAEAADLLIPRIEALLPRLTLSWENRNTRILKTALGYDAALVGAAALALDAGRSR